MFYFELSKEATYQSLTEFYFIFVSVESKPSEKIYIVY